MIHFEMGDDFELSGAITYFESYMLYTTDKHVEKFNKFDNEVVIYNGREVYADSMETLEKRKSYLTKFNQIAKEKLSKPLNPKSYSCILVEITDDKNIYNEEEINLAYSQIRDILVDFCDKYNRIALLTQHFNQKNRVPHIHILVEREKRKHNEFQDFLNNTYKEI